MKSKLKSAFISGFAALLLAGCDDLGLPHVFGGNEIPKEALDTPRLVGQPTAAEQENATWPDVGDVPSAPKNFSTPRSVELDVFDLMADRAEGQQEMKEYEELQAAKPPPLPPADVPTQNNMNFLQPPAR